jgi:hypothetical protein
VAPCGWTIISHGEFLTFHMMTMSRTTPAWGLGNNGRHEFTLRTILWKQFGAAIDMLDNALRLCPDELWRDRLWDNPPERAEYSQFWYLAYHALFWLDLYLTGAEEGFSPPAPFTLIELDEDGPLPERPYTKDELMAYLDYGRQKCRATIETLTDVVAHRRCRFGWGEVSDWVYSMRHVQGMRAAD